MPQKSSSALRRPESRYSTRYQVQKLVAEGIRRIHDFERDESLLWTAVTLRKNHNCCVCGLPILKGERAWSPVTFGQNRSHRAHGECFAA